MSEPEQRSGGVIGSFVRMLDGGLALAENRLELFAVELRQERWSLVETVIWASVVVACGMMVLALLTFLIVVLFWAESRVATLLALTGFYLLAACLAWRRLRARLADSSAFAGTLAEIRKDRSCLGKGN